MSASEVLEVLADLGDANQTACGEWDVAQKSIDLFEQRMGYEYGALLMATGPYGTLEPFALSRQGQDDKFLREDRVRVAEHCRTPERGITAAVAAYGHSIRLGNVLDDERYTALRDDIHSELCVPLRVRGKVVGVYNTESTRADHYSETDQRFLEVAADHMALAVENERLRALARFRADELLKASAAGNLQTICMFCQKVRVTEGTWAELRIYAENATGVPFSHGLCPACVVEA